MNLKNRFPATNIGEGYCHPSIEPSRTKKSGVQYIGTVSRRNYYYADSLVKPVHFHKDLVQSLLALIVASAKAHASVPSDCVNLVDKHYGRSVLPRPIKQIPDPGGSHAHEHLHKFTSAYGEERHSGLPSDSPRQQSLPGPGSSCEQHSLRYFSSKLPEFVGKFEKFNDLFKFLSRII